MPKSPVEGITAFFGAYVPARWRQLAGYTPHHEAFLWPSGQDPLQEVVRRACEVAAGIHYNGVLITEVRCESIATGWQIGYDAQIMLLDVEPEEREPEVLSLLGPRAPGVIAVPPEAMQSMWPMDMDDDWYCG